MNYRPDIFASRPTGQVKEGSAFLDQSSMAMTSATRQPIMGEAAAADMPAAIGYMILAVYGLMMAALVAFFTDGVEATMMVAISVIYTAIYFSVPSSFLRVEGRSGQMPLREFLRDGLSTWTGRIGGCEAILQILLIPAAITVALAAIGLLARLNQA